MTRWVQPHKTGDGKKFTVDRKYHFCLENSPPMSNLLAPPGNIKVNEDTAATLSDYQKNIKLSSRRIYLWNGWNIRNCTHTHDSYGTALQVHIPKYVSHFVLRCTRFSFSIRAWQVLIDGIVHVKSFRKYCTSYCLKIGFGGKKDIVILSFLLFLP